jgi:quercetin dioxygenase-like cupin family protein
MTQQTIGYVNPSNETIRLGPLAVRFLIAGENSSGTVAAFELIIPGAQRLAAPAHSHDHYEETIYGIDGVLTWTVDRKQIDVGPGQTLCIPRGAIHRFDNNGIQDAKALLRDHTSRDRSAVFPRFCRGDQRSRRGPAGPS